MLNDISIADQVACFLAGFGSSVALMVPYLIMHYARKAANAGAVGRD